MKVIPTVNTYIEAQKIARKLSCLFEQAGCEVPLSKAYDILSLGNDYRNWQTFSAVLKKKAQEKIPTPISQSTRFQSHLKKLGRLDHWEEAPNLKSMFKKITYYGGSPTLLSIKTKKGLSESPDDLIFERLLYSLGGIYIDTHGVPPEYLTNILKTRVGVYFTIESGDSNFKKLFHTPVCPHAKEYQYSVEDRNAVLKVFGTVPKVCNCHQVILWPIVPIDDDDFELDTFWDDECSLQKIVTRSLYSACWWVSYVGNYNYEYFCFAGYDEFLRQHGWEDLK